MKRIPISRAEAGMVLAEPAVLKAGGAVIVPEGTELTTALLERLRKRDITFVSIEDEKDGPPESSGLDLALEDMLARVDARFARVTEDSLMSEVNAVYKEVIAERHQRSRGKGDGGGT